MRMRMTVSVLTLLCSWVLWEKWTVHNPGAPTQHLIEAVSESKTLEECRAASPGFAKQRAAWFRMAYRESDYGVTEGDFAALLVDKHRKTTFQEYAYYCLSPTINPYRDTR